MPEVLKEGRDRGLSAAELAELCCDQPAVEYISASFMMSFRLAFGVPLPVLLKTAKWGRYYAGRNLAADEEINRLLSEWI